MSSRQHKTKEELRRDDIFKGTVAALLVILLLIAIATSAVDLDDIASLVSGSDTAVKPSVEALADLEISAPELLSPAPRSELTAGPVLFSGIGTSGSQIAVIAGGQELGRMPVAGNGGWELVVEMSPDIEEIELQALAADGRATASSPAIPFTVVDSAEQADAAAAEIFTADPLTGTAGAMMVTITGTGQPGYHVVAGINGGPAAETEINENGAWTVDVNSVEETAEVSVDLISPAGELLETVTLRQIEAALVVPPAIDAPKGDVTAGSTALTGSGQPDSALQIAANSLDISTVQGTVSGAVNYRERIALPDDAVLTVQIKAVSQQVAPAIVIAQQIIETNGRQVPIPYEVAFDPAAIDETAAYSMRARIEDGDGNLLFSSDSTIPIITNGNPTEDVPIATVQAGADGTAATIEEEANVTGIVTYEEEIALPDDAVVTVQIQDISTPGASATVIGEQIIKSEGQQIPVPYRVTYDPADIEENHTYSAAARIEDNAGNMLFINESAIPVITGDSQTEEVRIETVKVNTAVSDVVLDETGDLLGADGDSAVQAIAGSGNFSQLAEGLQAAGLTEALDDVDGEYTLFAPTDAAFASIPSELLAGWNAYPEAHADLMRHLVVEGKYAPDKLQNGLVPTSLAGKDITITREGGLVYANGVPVVDSAEVGNSIVYAMPRIILPMFGDGDALPVIDESGVSTFVGPLLTVVGFGEPGTEIMLTVDGDPFGEIAAVESNGFWLVTQDINSGVHYILAYMLDDQGLLLGISKDVILPVP